MENQMSTENLPRRRLSGLKTPGQTTPKAQDGQQFFGENLIVPPPLSLSKNQPIESKVLTISSLATVVLVTVGLIGFYALTSRGGWSSFVRNLRGNSDEIASHHRLMAEVGIAHYELVPDIRTTRPHVGRVLEAVGEKRLYLSLSVMDTIHELELVRTDTLLAPDYSHVLLHTDGSQQVDDEKNDCVYHASIRGDPDSFGSVSLCHEQLQAMLFHKTDGEKEFTVAPLSENMHVMYRNLAVKRHLRPCPLEGIQRESSRNLDEGPWTPIGKRNKTVKLIVVNDAKRFKQYGTKTAANTLTIINAVNSFYSKIFSSNMYGIRFQVQQQVTLADNDGWKVDNDGSGIVDSQMLLDQFYEWKKASKKVRGADIVHLFSGLRFKEGYVGRSAQAGSSPDGVCTDRNVGVIQTTGFDMGLYAKISAHELGHSLSLIHDDHYLDASCKATHNTYMWSGISLQEGTIFTTCSVKTLKDFLEGRAQYPYLGCLEDK